MHQALVPLIGLGDRHALVVGPVEHQGGGAHVAHPADGRAAVGGFWVAHLAGAQHRAHVAAGREGAQVDRGATQRCGAEAVVGGGERSRQQPAVAVAGDRQPRCVADAGGHRSVDCVQHVEHVVAAPAARWLEPAVPVGAVAVAAAVVGQQDVPAGAGEVQPVQVPGAEHPVRHVVRAAVQVDQQRRRAGAGCVSRAQQPAGHRAVELFRGPGHVDGVARPRRRVADAAQAAGRVDGGLGDHYLSGPRIDAGDHGGEWRVGDGCRIAERPRPEAADTSVVGRAPHRRAVDGRSSARVGGHADGDVAVEVGEHAPTAAGRRVGHQHGVLGAAFTARVQQAAVGQHHRAGGTFPRPVVGARDDGAVEVDLPHVPPPLSIVEGRRERERCRVEPGDIADRSARLHQSAHITGRKIDHVERGRRQLASLAVAQVGGRRGDERGAGCRRPSGGGHGHQQCQRGAIGRPGELAHRVVAGRERGAVGPAHHLVDATRIGPDERQRVAHRRPARMPVGRSGRFGVAHAHPPVPAVGVEVGTRDRARHCGAVGPEHRVGGHRSAQHLLGQLHVLFVAGQGCGMGTGSPS